MGRIARTDSSPEKLFTINIACRQRDGNGTNVLLGKPRIPLVSNDTCARSIRYNSFMPRLKGLGNIVAELRAERAHLVNNLRHVDAALAVLGKLEGGKFATVSRRTLSATARRKIAAAQRARWARVKAKQAKAK
jgi:hypothetical protein